MNGLMRTVFKWAGRIVSVLFILVACLFWLAFCSPRPENMIDPSVLAGDGSLINYCELPTLDGSGLSATDIPKGNTPGCAYERFPLPILSECTEPLVDGAEDIRGLWQATSGNVGHVERIEQCGSRTVITTAGIIHDMGPNSTGGLGSNDTEGSVFFVARGKDYCMRTSAHSTWRNGQLEFNVFGWGPVVVRRYPDGDDVIWEYADGSTTRMKRICTLPDEHKTPKPRGQRRELF
jgi:hypothetical protein